MFGKTFSLEERIAKLEDQVSCNHSPDFNYVNFFNVCSWEKRCTKCNLFMGRFDGETVKRERLKIYEEKAREIRSDIESDETAEYRGHYKSIKEKRFSILEDTERLKQKMMKAQERYASNTVEVDRHKAKDEAFSDLVEAVKEYLED